MASLGGYDENAEPSAGFDALPIGDYTAEIVEGTHEDISKNNDYGKCLNLTWKIIEGPYENRLVWQRLNLWGQNMNNNAKVVEIANSQFAAIRKATGKNIPQDTDELLHIPCIIRLSLKADNSGRYPPRNEVQSVKALDGGGTSKPSTQQNAKEPAKAGASAKKNPWD